MRDYGKVFCDIWASEDFRSLSEDGRALVLYLLTCQHCTAVGAFRLPDGYAMEDLQWVSERVSKGFVELSRKGFATRDERSKWVVIHKYLEWNPIENPNQAKSVAKLVAQVPECEAKLLLVNAIRASGRFVQQIGIEPLRNPSETVSKPGTGAVTGTEAGKEQEQRALVSAEAPDPPPPREPSPEGDTCRRLIKLGIPQVNPSHPALLDLLRDGATPEGIEQTAAELAQRGRAPGFKLVLATVRGRMEDVAAGLSTGRSIRAPPTRASISTPLPEPGSYGQSDIPDDWTPAQAAS